MRCRTLLKDSATTIRYNYRNVQPLNLRPVAKVDVTQNLENKLENLKDELGGELHVLDDILVDAVNESRELLGSLIESLKPENLISLNWKYLNKHVSLRYFSPDSYTYSNVSCAKLLSYSKVRASYPG